MFTTVLSLLEGRNILLTKQPPKLSYFTLIDILYWVKWKILFFNIIFKLCSHDRYYFLILFLNYVPTIEKKFRKWPIGISISYTIHNIQRI